MQKIKVKCPAKTTSALDEQSEELEMRRPELVSGSRGLRVQCPAKINLTLEILNKREDGFHNIQSVMQTINLYDYLTSSRFWRSFTTVASMPKMSALNLNGFRFRPRI